MVVCCTQAQRSGEGDVEWAAEEALRSPFSLDGVKLVVAEVVDGPSWWQPFCDAPSLFAQIARVMVRHERETCLTWLDDRGRRG